MCPAHGTTVLIVDPATDSVEETTITGLPSGFYKWAAPTLFQDTVFCMPLSHDAVLKIDTATDTVDYTTITGAGSSIHKFGGSVLADNGKIYGIPYNTDPVAIIDPVTNTMDLTTIVPTGSGNGYNWRGGAKANDGRIYCAPYYADCILIITPESDTVDETSLCPNNPGGLYGGAAFVPSTGRIYMIPVYASNVVIVNTNTDTLDTASISNLDLPDAAYFSAVTAGSTVFAIPSNEQDIMIIDATDNSVSFESSGVDAEYKWPNAVLANNSKLYCTPSGTNTILVIDTTRFQ